MEKATSLTPQEWEALIEDFQSGDSSRQLHWLSKHSAPLSLLQIALASILRRDFPLKSLVVLYLEEFGHLLIRSPAEDAAQALSSLSEALDMLLRAPADSSNALKEQMMVAVTSIAIAIDGLDHAPRQFSAVVETLLVVANRPNHSPDRQTRSIACDCLRELEEAFPCLLSETSSHLWNLCQSERTHAVQSYVLLLTAVVRNIVRHSNPPTVGGILSTSLPLVPFNAPEEKKSGLALSDENLRDVKKVMAFLLERPMILTPMGIAQLIFMLIRVVVEEEAQIGAAAAVLLKVQFSGLLSSYHPMLCHAVLTLCSRLPDAFSGDDLEIARRLTVLSKETQQPLVFRVLALHWLLGVVASPTADKNALLISMAASFYPDLFDPLALKAAKLDVLAWVAASLESGEQKEQVPGVSPVKLYQDGLVCVSAFKWLPPWSTETLIVFRTLHKFLIGAVSGSDSEESLLVRAESTTFCSLQGMLIDMVLENRELVPVAAAFLDRLKNGSQMEVLLGERLLQAMDESLLPKLELDLTTSAYFSILERIAENNKIPPRSLLEFLLKYMAFLSKKRGPDSGPRLWTKGSQVLRICRTLMTTHQSTRIFNPLSRLLSFTCQCYPDLEVRDNARIYLRMLICIPGKKLRQLLNPGEQPPAVAPPPQSGFFYEKPSLPSPSSIVCLQRSTPLLLNQSWSLAIREMDGYGSPEPIKDPPHPTAETRADAPRVVDSKAAEILKILRRHFSCIPDYRHMKGLKVEIPCVLSLNAEALGQPALFAVVLTFSSSAAHGPIPCRRVPFLHGARRSAVALELEPREPAPGPVSVAVRANAADGLLLSGQLDSVPVGFEDMFQKVPLPEEISGAEEARLYLLELFKALWEACSSARPSETFPLKGAKGVAAVQGTESVKLLDGGGGGLVDAVRRRLAPFIVSVEGGTLLLEYRTAEESGDAEIDGGGSSVVVLVLIFLPPRFHLLFRMEVSDSSTLVRIRTDNWQCLAYVDEFLESLL
ncbi:AP-5 complex subunit beta-like protein [Wolffia australiana]